MPWFLHLQTWQVWPVQEKNTRFVCAPPFTSTTCSAQGKLSSLLKTLKKGWYCSVEFCGKQLFFLERRKHMLKRNTGVPLFISNYSYVLLLKELLKTPKSVWTASLQKEGVICSFNSNCTTAISNWSPRDQGTAEGQEPHHVTKMKGNLPLLPKRQCANQGW